MDPLTYEGQEFSLEPSQDYQVLPYNEGNLTIYTLELAIFAHQYQEREDGSPYITHPHAMLVNFHDFLYAETTLEKILNKIKIEPRHRWGIFKEYKQTGFTKAEVYEAPFSIHDVVEDCPEFSNDETLDDKLKEGVYYIPDLLSATGEAGVLICEILRRVTKYRSGEDTLQEFSNRLSVLVKTAMVKARDSGYRLPRSEASEFGQRAHHLFESLLSRELYPEQIARALSPHPNKDVTRGSALLKLFDNNHNNRTIYGRPPKKQLMQAVKMLASGAPEQIKRILVPRRFPGSYLVFSLLYYNPKEINRIMRETYNNWHINTIQRIIKKGEFETEDTPLKLGERVVAFFKDLKNIVKKRYKGMDNETYMRKIDDIGLFLDELSDDLSMNDILLTLQDKYQVQLNPLQGGN